MVRNKYSAHKSITEKMLWYRYGVANGELAHKSDGTTVPLAKLLPSRVEFVAGKWRVQNKFPYQIQMIRDREMVLLKQLPHQDHVLFDYYTAAHVGYNCYGPFILSDQDYIVAKYVTDDGVYWGYGRTLEQARAFLGIRLYDQYMDLIHTHACQKRLGRQKK